ncbi:hypothetical protein ACGVWS_02760 [Enterobacteriaceae bacterium LUAb1]
MEPVSVFTLSYPTFLWITWCKILFIASGKCTTTLIHPARNPLFILKK